ncbi:hypothetical protein [Streptomyces sp. NPDC086776]|uniref:hypothetical protein n=1 Tax=Streptomyces sp. NPDC086776 TaxID=3365756 RepID=UPI00381A0CEF
MTRAVLRYVMRRITQHSDTDVTYEAECLWCAWQATPSTDGAAVDRGSLSTVGCSGNDAAGKSHRKS